MCRMCKIPVLSIFYVFNCNIVDNVKLLEIQQKYASVSKSSLSYKYLWHLLINLTKRFEKAFSSHVRMAFSSSRTVMKSLRRVCLFGKTKVPLFAYSIVLPYRTLGLDFWNGFSLVVGRISSGDSIWRRDDDLFRSVFKVWCLFCHHSGAHRRWNILRHVWHDHGRGTFQCAICGLEFIAQPFCLGIFLILWNRKFLGFSSIFYLTWFQA